MAPAQVIEPKDMPPEVLAAFEAAPAQPAARPAASVREAPALMPSPSARPEPAVAGQPAVGLVQPGAEPDAGVTPWEQALGAEAMELLSSGKPEVWDLLTRRFESRIINAALAVTKGRRIEAAQKLGIGRNTITRKIQELGLE